VSPPPEQQQLRILFATPECAPLVKTGGLGDVSAALPAALLEAGVDVRMLLPGYPAVLASLGADPVVAARASVLGQDIRLLEGKLESGVPLYVLASDRLFNRGGGPYQADDGDDWDDNAVRFGVLSRTAALLGSLDSPLAWRPQVVHAHDWPAALAPLYLSFETGWRAASMITIHNLAFQGVFDWHQLGGLGIPESARGIDGVEFYGKASFLKGGLVAADAITTVSPTYAREIQTEEFGFGMDGLLRHRSRALHGVLNGIDTATWDPTRDPHLASNYGLLTLERKAANKRLIKQKLSLGGPDDAPLAAIVSRLSHQKGIDLVVNAAPALLARGLQIAVIGVGDRPLADALLALKRQHPGRVGVFIGFDEGLAHLLEAGADLFLMPSRFEPCGMNQMYSQRYGTPPVVTSTGGLADTVSAGTGFIMSSVTAEALVAAIDEAIAAYRDPKRWRKMQTAGMTRDFGWSASARAYAELYRRITPTS
jgi:starch synthase